MQTRVARYARSRCCVVALIVILVICFVDWRELAYARVSIVFSWMLYLLRYRHLEVWTFIEICVTLNIIWYYKKIEIVSPTKLRSCSYLKENIEGYLYLFGCKILCCIEWKDDISVHFQKDIDEPARNSLASVR